jgi:bacteriorhodopsin
MSKTRYYDWFITTPTMLLTSIIYFEYLNRIESKTSSFRFQEFVQDPENQKNISFIFTANFLMLLFGYLYESEVIDKKTATFLGYVFFLITFQFIYEKYAKKSQQGKQLFAVLFITWAIYGIAFLLPDIEKNNITNFLDLFAKNFFGVFLVYQAVNLSSQS